MIAVVARELSPGTARALVAALGIAVGDMLLGFLAIVGLAAALILFHASLMPLIIDPRQLAVGGVLAILAIIFLVTVVGLAAMHSSQAAVRIGCALRNGSDYWDQAPAA